MVYPLVRFMKFASNGFKLSQRDDVTPDCGLDLECGNQILVHATPSHYALLFVKFHKICFSNL